MADLEARHEAELYRLLRDREGTGNHCLAGDDRCTGREDHKGQAQFFRRKKEKGIRILLSNVDPGTVDLKPFLKSTPWWFEANSIELKAVRKQIISIDSLSLAQYSFTIEPHESLFGAVVGRYPVHVLAWSEADATFEVIESVRNDARGGDYGSFMAICGMD